MKKLIFWFFVLFLLVISMSSAWTPQDDIDLRNIRQILNTTNITGFFGVACSGGEYVSDIADNGSFVCSTPGASTLTSGIGIDINATNFVNLNLSFTDNRYYNQSDANNTFILQSSESDLNVNSSVYWDDETSQGDLNVNSSNQSLFWDSLDSPLDFVNVGTFGITSYVGNLINVTSGFFIDLVGITINATEFYQAGQLVLDASDEANLNVNTSNESNYWDNLDTPADINAADINDDGTYILSANEGDLNVNRSNYWDDLNSPSDITSLGTLSSLTMSGNIDMDSNSIVNYFSTACPANQFMTNISAAGVFSCGSVTAQANLTGSTYIYVNATNGIYLNETESLNSLKVNGSVFSDSATSWDGETSQADLNVNRSNYWDDLNSPSDITGLDSNNIASLNASKINNFDIQCAANTFVTTVNMSDESTVCSAVTGFLSTSGGTMAGNIDMGNYNISNISNLINYFGSDCPADNYAYGINSDGSLDCRADQSGGGGGSDAWTNDSTTVSTSLDVDINSKLNITDSSTGNAVYAKQESSGYAGWFTKNASGYLLKVENIFGDLAFSVGTNGMFGHPSATQGSFQFNRNVNSSISAGTVWRIQNLEPNDDQPVVQIRQSAQEYVLQINNNYHGTDSIIATLADDNGPSYSFERDLGNSTTDGVLFYIKNDATDDDQSALLVQQDSAGGFIQEWYFGGTQVAALNTSGGLQLDGLITKGGGSFTIDHPLDPTNKILQHSFVESPEMRNNYYGQARTQGRSVTIQLPDWWQALNGYNKSEYNYQFTPMGKWCNLWVSKEIENNKFEVSSNTDCKFSWTVSGVRHDAFAESNRIQVEVDKVNNDVSYDYKKVVTEESGIRQTKLVPEPKKLDSKRKGSCIHESACKNVNVQDLIKRPKKPKEILVKNEVLD